MWKPYAPKVGKKKKTTHQSLDNYVQVLRLYLGALAVDIYVDIFVNNVSCSFLVKHFHSGNLFQFGCPLKLGRWMAKIQWGEGTQILQIQIRTSV